VKRLWLTLALLLPAAACADHAAVPVADEASSAADATAAVSSRRVWAGPEVDLIGKPSPDGRYLSVVDWSTGNLALRDLEAGAHRKITDKQSWEESASFAEFSVFSPDGEHLAFGWFTDDWRFELRTVPVAGGEQRVIFRGEGVAHIRPRAWSRDGRSILASLIRQDGTVHLAMIPARGGAPRILRSLGMRVPRGADLSPDGRFVVTDVPRDESGHRDIIVLDVESGREWPLVSDPSESFVLGWAPDGGSILFASDRGGTMGIWTVPIAAGRAAGEPAIVQPDEWRILPLGFTDDGRYFYGVETGNRDVHAVSLDRRTGEAISAAVPLRGDAVPGQRASWSLDGRYIAAPTRPAGTGAPPVIRIRDTAGHTVRDLPTAFRTIHDVVWSSDGGSLFVYAVDVRRQRGIFRLALDTGTVSSLLGPGERLHVRHLAHSPDGRALFYVRNSPEGPPGFAIFRLELQSGRETLLHSPGALRIATLMRLSPDGRWLVFGEHPGQHNRTDVIRSMPATGGPPREIYRSEEPNISELAWSPDGGFLVFGKRTGEARDADLELWRLPATGGEPAPLGISAPALRDLHFHPDGRRLIFTAGLNFLELWVLEGLGVAAGAASATEAAP
jgi:Tol biopolymer transport system component